MLSIPDSAQEFDAEWLSQALGSTVVSFETEFLEGGVLADAYRLSEIRYASRREGAPESVIVKLASRSEKRREMAIDNGAYRKELGFFRDPRERGADAVARRPSRRVRRQPGGPAVRPRDGGPRRPLPGVRPDRRPAGCRVHAAGRARSRGAAREVLGGAELRLDWLSQSEHRYVFTFDAACRESPDRLDEFVALWQQMYGRSVFDEGGVRNSEAITRILCGPESGAILDRVADRLSQRPHTLLHGDLRADNIFRSDPERGVTGEESRLAYIDWQLMGPGPPGLEFSQAWIHSLVPAVRRNDTAVLRRYHERLLAMNAAAGAYSLEMLIEDYVVGLCLWWTALVTIGANTLPDFEDPESARMKRLWEVSIPRTLIALEDHGCLGVVENLANG